jgi:hypothetical protein
MRLNIVVLDEVRSELSESVSHLLEVVIGKRGSELF